VTASRGRRGLGALALLVASAACSSERPGLVGPDILYVATPTDVALEMLRLASVTRDDVVYDLGSGDGRLVIEAARTFGASGVGVEIDPGLIQQSRDSAARAGVADRVRFVWDDLFRVSVSEATVVTLYLSPDVNRRLRPKLLRELAPGARVVSHEFDMGDWRPDRTRRAQGPTRRHVIYEWDIPADVRGTWRWTTAWAGRDHDLVLTLEQRYQDVRGSLLVDGNRREIQATLDGSGLRLRTTVAGESGVAVEFAGTVRGDTITGEATAADGGQPRRQDWNARRTREGGAGSARRSVAAFDAADPLRIGPAGAVPRLAPHRTASGAEDGSRAARR
jgi:SAM-dependent methyltransferase